MAEQEVVREAANVVDSSNAATFYAERLGLADQEPTEAESVKEDSEPEQAEAQSEPEAKEDAREQKRGDKLNKRFDKVTKRAQQAEAEARELREKLQSYEARVNPQEQPKTVIEGKPAASQFNDAFEYAEALAEWSAENALRQRDEQEASRKAQEAQEKLTKAWSEKIAKAKENLPDFDRMVKSSDIVISDPIRDSIIDSDVGPQLLYHLATNEDFAKELTEMPVAKALKQLGKLEAQFEAKDTPKAEKKNVSSSKAPEPIKPLSGGKVGKDVMIDTNGEFHGTYAQWKAARQAGKVR